MRNLHLIIAHQLWEKHLQHGGVVIDATAGNGHDTLFLAQILKQTASWMLYSIDIQDVAIDNTKKRLNEGLSSSDLTHIKLLKHSHSPFPTEIQANTVSLIVYNLGYLPGGDKTITTQTNSSIQSISEGLNLLTPGGLISITCYPGHEEGAKESEAILDLIKRLPPTHYQSFFFLSSCSASPFLILAIKK